MFRVPVVIVLACALLVPALVGAREPTPEPPALPASTAPFRLATVTLPGDAAGVEALFGQFPPEVAGEPRAVTPAHERGDRIVAAYGAADPNFGPPLVLQAMNFSTGDFFPRDFTVADFVASASATSDYDTTQFGLDGDLAWIRSETMAGAEGGMPGTPSVSQPIYTLAWGEADSQWIFTAAAFSPDGLDDLVSAFVATASMQPATPATDATPAAHRRSGITSGSRSLYRNPMLARAL